MPKTSILWTGGCAKSSYADTRYCSRLLTLSLDARGNRQSPPGNCKQAIFQLFQ